MILFPAVDILDGRSVRLLHGKRDAVTDYGDPVDRAVRWAEAGAKFLHVVDLNGAFGDGDNAATIARIVRETSLPVQVGGGIKSVDRAAYYIEEAGAERVIVGSAIALDPDAADAMCARFGRRIVAGIDVKDGFVAVEQNSALQPFGQNLYTILKDGFYLQKGAVGALAQKKIKDILEDVKTVKALELSPQTDPHGVQRALDNWERRLEGHRKKTLRYLPKGILRGKLEEELAAALARLDRRWDPERRERKKQELSQEIARLQRQLYELENGGETLP